jgi:hypothetical protein
MLEWRYAHSIKNKFIVQTSKNAPTLSSLQRCTQLRASSVIIPKSHANGNFPRVLGWTWTLALQHTFWILQYLSTPWLGGTSLAILLRFPGGTPSHCTRLHVHIINAIQNIQWDQPLRCKCLSFDLSCAIAFVQGRGERQPHGCKKKIQWTGVGLH